MQEKQGKAYALVGLATIGASITGVVSFIVALFALFSGEFMAAGVCFIAAALSFGLLSNSILRE